MESTDDFKNILEGKAKAVEVEAIARELKTLWKEAAAQPKDGQAVMRACVLNLVVYMAGEADSEVVMRAIGEVTLRHPCRAIIIMAGGDALESGINAWVVAQCHPAPGGRKQVCSEQVMISAEGKNLDQVPSIVIPLLLPDLPVFLWWRDRVVFGNDFFEQFVDASDRVIIDSSMMTAPEANLDKLSQQATTWSRATALSDLNWSRLTPWRALMAGFYDVPDFRIPLARLDRVVIAYQAAPGGEHRTPAQALLIAGWLAGQLHWQPASDLCRAVNGSHVLSLRENDRNITVELRPSASGSNVCGLMTVELASTGEPAGRFAVSKTPDGLYLQSEVDLAGVRSLRHVVPLETAAEARLISQELDLMGPDRVYNRTLEMAGSFASAINRAIDRLMNNE